MFGRIGAVIGNIVVGVFIDAHCMVPILVSFSLLMSKYKYLMFEKIEKLVQL